MKKKRYPKCFKYLPKREKEDKINVISKRITRRFHLKDENYIHLSINWSLQSKMRLLQLIVNL